METIGIIGGLGPHSTIKYYEWLTQGVNDALGGVNSAKIILTSLNGEEIKNIRLGNDKEAEGLLFAEAARTLEAAGADFILIASNTSHKNAPYVEDAVFIPLLHLADVTAEHIKDQSIESIVLIGTRPTMEQEFYKSRLVKQGLKVIIPNEAEREFINTAIHEELVKGIIKPDVSAAFTEIIERTKDMGAQGAILGCTELTLLNLKNTKIPLFDTTRIHVNAALKRALSS